MKIPGVKLKKLKIINNPKGNIYKYISKKDSIFKKFGEVYFSEIFKGKIKGWNLHKKNTCIICVPSGKVKFILLSNGKNFFIKEKKNASYLEQKKTYCSNNSTKHMVFIYFYNKNFTGC